MFMAAKPLKRWIVGGATLLAGVVGGSGTTEFDVWTVLVASLGALALLYVYGHVVRRTA